MTVAALPSSKDYIEDGVTLNFALPFRFGANSIAASRVLGNGAVVDLIAGVDFTTTGGATDAGGTATLTATVAGGRLRFRRVTPRAQATDYTPNDRFPAESHEAALDRAMLIDQEQDDKIAQTGARALLVPDGETAPPVDSLAGHDGELLMVQGGHISSLSKAGFVGKYFVGDATGAPIPASGTGGGDAALRSDLGQGTGAGITGWIRSAANAVTRSLAMVLATLPLSPFDFKPQAATDDQLAIVRAVAAGRETTNYNIPSIASYWANRCAASVRLPTGEYTMTDVVTFVAKAGFAGTASLRLYADGLGDVVIKVPPGKYFSDCNERLNSVSFENLIFTGGKGTFLQRDTGVNVNGFRQFHNCYFDGYTECALGSNAADDPYWRVTQCIFMAALGSSARGVALGGLLDGSVVGWNSFLRNQYHCVAGPLNSGNIHYVFNDFLSFTAGAVAADLVFTPNNQPLYGLNAGQATIVGWNKFGNEGLDPNAPRVLFAGYDTGTGTGRENWPISTAWITDAGGTGVNYIRGIQFIGNRNSFGGAHNAPFMRSRVDRVDGILVEDDNSFDGGRPTYGIEWMGTRTIDHANTNWDWRIGRYGRDYTNGLPFSIGVSNQQIGPIANDIGASMGRMGVIPFAAPAGNERNVKYCNGQADWLTLGGSTKAAVAGPNAGASTLATQVTAISAGSVALYADVNATGATAGTHHLYFSLWRDPARSVTRVQVELFNYVTGKTANRSVETLSDRMQPLPQSFSFDPGSSPTTWQIRLTAVDYTVTTADRFVVGEFYLHDGSAPRPRPMAAALANPVDAATTQAAVIAALDILRSNNLMARS